MKKIFIIGLLLLTGILKSQPGKEAWHWRYGQASLDFSSGAPVPQTPGMGYIDAACASISDENTGQYLFFTNGVNAVDKTGFTMPNGGAMMGNNSTSQTLIVPHPGNPNLYFVISVDHNAGPKGVHYSIIDLTQHNGLGTITIKNKLLTPAPAAEKVTAVRHCNGKDYWVITHPFNSNAFNAYLVNSAGIDTTPVVSYAGTVHHFFPPYNLEAGGYMKASPNGAMLAVAINSDSLPVLEILNINNSTGIVSNPITITSPGGGGPYGVSFSPDNSKIYTCEYPGDTISSICQYDLSSGIPSTIIASKTVLGQKKWNVTNGPTTGMVTAFQMGPDGKVYVARKWLDTLAVINNPNLAGTACNFQWNGIITGPPYYQYAAKGLPNFIDANYAGIQMNIPDVRQCNTFTTTTVDAGPGFAGYQWNTGAFTQTINITGPGKYWVTVTNAQGCQRTDTMQAFLLAPLKQDTLACDLFKANVSQAGGVQYNWYDGYQNPIRNFTHSGSYYVDISYTAGCAIRDSINLTIVPSPQIDIGPDTSFCKGNLMLNAQCSTCTYQWSTGQSSATITAKVPGVYWVKVVDTNGCTGSDTLTVHPQLTAFDFVMPNVATPNDDGINDVIDFSRYQFSEFQIQIFNRWGKQVFESSDADAVWKPTGDEGTYFYTGQYRINCDVNSQTKNIRGYITLMR